MPRNHIVAAFENAEDAHTALRELRSEHFAPRRLGILSRGHHHAPLHRSLLAWASVQPPRAGGASGTTFPVGVLTLPAIGEVVGGGALLTNLGTTDGAVEEALKSMSVADPDAAFYEQRLAAEQTLVSVEVRTWSESALALDIITSHGGYQRRLAA